MVGDDDAFDHVADDGRPRTPLQLDRDDSPVGDAAQRTIDTGNARWAAKTRSDQTPTTNLAADGAGGVGEVEGGVADGHVVSVAQGCYSPDVTPLG